MDDLGGILFAGGVKHAFYYFSRAVVDFMGRGALPLVHERKDELAAALASRRDFFHWHRNRAVVNFLLTGSGKG